MSDMTIFFMGDSITDGNRCKDESLFWDKNHVMGHSYAYIVSALLGSTAKQSCNFVNRGISGSMVGELMRDIPEAALLKPDIISILVGINDGPVTDTGEYTAPEDFRRSYDELLTALHEATPASHVILLEPFVFAELRGERESLWQSLIPAYSAIVSELAAKHSALFIPLRDKLEAAAKKMPPRAYWLWDGIHPTESGHGIIAREWLNNAEKYGLTANVFE